MGIGLTGLLAENLACHPFVILRRQCQVNVESRRIHATPITLLPVLINLNRWQGVAVLWKGIGSSLTIKGMTLGVEDCLSKITPWPKDVDKHSSLKMIGQHLMLKCASTAILTPFYSASLVESVQSDIASEKPGIFDVFRDGIVRLISWSDPRCGRMLPVWVLIPPQVFHSVAHYIISTVVQGVWLQVLKATHREYQKLTGAVSRDPQLGNLPGLSQYQAQAAALTGHLVAESLLFPLETVLHRLHLQGTRSIIDNLDTGREVVPILTRYEGVSDCFSTILREEGIKGLFKGFGALLLQYGAYFLVIKFSSKIISQVAQLVSGHSPKFPFPDIKGEFSTSKEASPRTVPPMEQSFPPTTVQGPTDENILGLSRSPTVRRRAGPLAEDFEREPSFGSTGDPLRASTSKLGLGEPIPAWVSDPARSDSLGMDQSPSGFPSMTLGQPSSSTHELPGSGVSPLRGSGGLPPLLSFSKSTSSPHRRILPDREYSDYRDPWRSMDQP